MNNITRKTIGAWTVEIFIAGNLADAERACRKYCQKGLCVTVQPCEYVYTGGQESGVRIGLKAYPKFPKERGRISLEAEGLAAKLMDALFQNTCMVCSPDQHIWLSRGDHE